MKGQCKDFNPQLDSIVEPIEFIHISQSKTVVKNTILCKSLDWLMELCKFARHSLYKCTTPDDRISVVIHR